jgi:hypothetical protein
LPRVRRHLANIPFPNGWQLSLVFPVLDVSLFEMQMSIICINRFSVLLQDRRASVTLRTVGPEMLGDNALREDNVCLNLRVVMHWQKSAQPF